MNSNNTIVCLFATRMVCHRAVFIDEHVAPVLNVCELIVALGCFLPSRAQIPEIEQQAYMACAREAVLPRTVKTQHVYMLWDLCKR